MAEKPMKDHKLISYNYGVSVRCECGWVSGTWYGKGGRGFALSEWRNHKAKVEDKIKANQ